MAARHVIATATAATLVAGGLLATAGGAGASPADHKRFTIKVTTIETDSEVNRTGDNSINNGDSYTYTARLEQKGKKVGSERGRCVLSNVVGSMTDDPNAGVDYTCKITLTINGSKIKIKGTDRESFRRKDPNLRFPIVDGTKRFKNAEGTASYIPTTKVVNIVLKFTADD